MHGLRRKFTMAALAASALLGGLAAPATASAASSSYAQVNVCNQSPEKVTFWFVGRNQHGDWINSRGWDIPPRGCTLVKDYWWLVGRSVEFHHYKPSAGWKWEPRVIPNGQRNGSTYTIFTN